MSTQLESLLLELEGSVAIFDRIHKYSEIKYCSTQQLILDLGISFESKIDSPFLGEPNACYKNCFQTLSDSSNVNLYYCEGFAIHEGLGMSLAHAWLINDLGEVIDPTWQEPESFINYAYFGAVFDWEFVVAVAVTTKKCGIFETDSTTEYEFKRLGLPFNALHPKWRDC